MILMAWILFAILFLAAMDVTYALIGLLLSCFPYRKHPMLHRAGLHFLAMSFLTYPRVLPRRCEKVCGVDPCGCWTCPGQAAYSKKDGQDLDA